VGGESPPAESVADRLYGRLLSAAQVRELRPPDALVEGLLTLDSEAWLIAKPGSYKTFVALDIAGHVAIGRPWQGREVARGPVLYVAAEGAGGLGARVRAWEQRNGPMVGVHFLPVAVQAARDEQWAALVEVAVRVRPVLIVLDTQARVTVGLNENDNSEMGRFVHAIGLLRRATSACVLTVHHLGRNGQDARGASAIDGAQDTELRLNRTADLRVVLVTDKQRHLSDDARVELELFTVDVDSGGSSLVVGAPLSTVTQPDYKANLPINQATLVDVMADVFMPVGATKPELKSEVRKRNRRGPDGAVMEPMSESGYRKAWSELVGRGRFLRVEGKQQYVLANDAIPSVDLDLGVSE